MRGLLTVLMMVLQGLPSLAAYRRGMERCPENTPHCLAIDLFVALEEGVPGYSARWWRDQFWGLRRHFGPLGVAFRVRHVRALPDRYNEIRRRADRNALARFVRRRGAVPVFLAGKLHNIDAEGELRGVHWRDRGRRGFSWIILGARRPAPDFILAHEMGHFFDLPHSRYPESIMNKRPRLAPAPRTWSFAGAEQARIRRALVRHLRSGKLVELPASPRD